MKYDTRAYLFSFLNSISLFQKYTNISKLALMGFILSSKYVLFCSPLASKVIWRSPQYNGTELLQKDTDITSLVA